MGDETASILGFDHVQVTAPRAAEERAKQFYGGVLGLREIPKPAALAGRGGAWYQCGDLQLHLGLEDDFAPQRKAHPAFRVPDLEAVRARLEAAGCPIAVDVQLPGVRRFEARDPFGNRLEFLQRIEEGGAGDGSGEAAGVKARVRDQFGRAAEAYVTSAGHARGDDLARLVELAAPTKEDVALDVSTGGGHTALALAARAGRVVASDLTPRMLAAARRFIVGAGATNVDYVVADAEALPFLDETFDLVTVRIAPHHYADVRRAAREMARVLKTGGRLALIDNIAPEDAALDRHLNDWERRRDPSHVRAYTVGEWRDFLAAAGLRVVHLETARKAHDFTSWTERMRMPAAERDALARDILAAPPEARDYFDVTERDGRLVSFGAYYMLCLALR